MAFLFFYVISFFQSRSWQVPFLYIWIFCHARFFMMTFLVKYCVFVHMENFCVLFFNMATSCVWFIGSTSFLINIQICDFSFFSLGQHYWVYTGFGEWVVASHLFFGWSHAGQVVGERAGSKDRSLGALP